MAKRVEQDFADGSAYVRLGTIRDPGSVPSAVAQTFGVHERDGRPLQDLLVTELRDRHVLLVLDNFEQLLAEPPTWLAELIGGCPRMKVLVTSRSALNIVGEYRYLVRPLPVPGAIPDREVPEPASVTLFIQRAHAVQATFVLDDAGRDNVGEICRRLEGLPLAIELASARVNLFTPDQILSRLTPRLPLLSGGRRDAPARQRSMQDAIGWSYDLLTVDEQRLFQQLSVFMGGFTSEAADAIGRSRALSTVAGVTSLVDKSLLRVTTGDARGEPRFVMLETIREYGLKQLGASGLEAAVRDRHADWCVSLARTATPVDPASQLAWFGRLEAEQDNLASALTWLDDTGRMNDLADLLTEARWLWYQPGRETEGLMWFERVLARHPNMSDITRCDALRWAGHLVQRVGRPDADAYLEDALLLARAAGDIYREAEATEMLAVLAENRGRYADAEARFLSARKLYQQSGNAWAQLTIDYHLGVVAYGNGQLAQAATLLEAARSGAEAFGDHVIPVKTRSFLALIACEQGNPGQAISLLSQGPPEMTAIHRHERPIFMSAAGVVACTCKDFACAARLFGAAARSETTFMLPERATFDRAATISREQLGDFAFDREWEAGRRDRKADHRHA